MLANAVRALQELIADMRCSSVYESPALLPEGAPQPWDVPYLNMAVCGQTQLLPKEMLVRVKMLEQALGRKPQGHWGPREIDIDILAYDDQVLAEYDLTVPHAELLNRDFALCPLAELLPLWRYPVPGKWFGQTAQHLVSRMGPSARIKGRLVL